ncbi:hypothetical protein D9757_010168 [Collybiopsis confluens]|uniref:Uncharacterized protein n=1 Tax=Collybiopsis confluens TaxID=2823264 RepID=A0A8H5H1B3_9AGAR|nr:hypothetical protein D9757_010168 [Collybiopsis confluens]
MANNLNLEPPPYTFDVSIPEYSSEPRADEARLEYQPGSMWPREYDLRRPTGLFVHRQDGVTVILNYQEDNITVPVYRRNSSIEGSIILEKPEPITKVTLKLSGIIEVASPGTGWVQVKCLDQTHALFRANEDSPDETSSWASSQTSLSRNVPNSGPFQFSCALPTTFRHDGRDYPLPPSYYVLLPGNGQAYYVKCTYNFTALVSKGRSRRTAFLPGKAKKVNTFGFEYSPRQRPPRGVIDRSLLASIKISPEEWRRYSYQIIPRTNKHGLEPLMCQFFLPSLGVYGVTDSIPFHVQILGPRASLSILQLDNKPLIRVHLTRQITVEHNTRNNTVNLSLGEASLRALPPVEGVLSLNLSETGQNQENINWDGKVGFRLEREKLVQAFNAGVVYIRDFIILELSKGYTNLFQLFRHGHFVRLVSDSAGPT